MGEAEIEWKRFPLVGETSDAKAWLSIQAKLGLAANTLAAYGRALEDYLAFSARCGIDPGSASKAHIASYVRDLTTRPNPRGPKVVSLSSGAGLSNATMLVAATPRARASAGRATEV